MRNYDGHQINNNGCLCSEFFIINIVAWNIIIALAREIRAWNLVDWLSLSWPQMHGATRCTCGSRYESERTVRMALKWNDLNKTKKNHKSDLFSRPLGTGGRLPTTSMHTEHIFRRILTILRTKKFSMGFHYPLRAEHVLWVPGKMANAISVFWFLHININSQKCCNSSKHKIIANCKKDHFARDWNFAIKLLQWTTCS